MWERVGALPLVVEGYTLEQLASPVDYGEERTTTIVHLLGAGEEGLGEDILPVEPDNGLHAAGPYLDLAGSWTLASFTEHLATVDQWHGTKPEWELAYAWRNWTFESAALDLALQQAGVGLAEFLGRSPAPLRFVNSLGLGDPPSAAVITERCAANPSVGFKLDAAADWNEDIVAELAGLRCVQTVDFKGRYGLEVPDDDALIAMYKLVIAAFPDALLEDPHDHPAVGELLAPVLDRVSFDAPIQRVADITTRTINVKPSRIGGLKPLFEIYEHCAAEGIVMYGGGMGENGIGRQQIELLASLFHPDAPNDVAPSVFNAKTLAGDLPSSPLVFEDLPPGFRL